MGCGVSGELVRCDWCSHHLCCCPVSTERPSHRASSSYHPEWNGDTSRITPHTSHPHPSYPHTSHPHPSYPHTSHPHPSPLTHNTLTPHTSHPHPSTSHPHPLTNHIPHNKNHSSFFTFHHHTSPLTPSQIISHTIKTIHHR